MIKLIKYHGKFLVFNKDTNVFTKGDIDEASETLYYAGIDADEISRGVEEMHESGDNVAVFGVDGTFIYSERSDSVLEDIA